MAQPNLTQNPGPGQAKSTKYGPPKSPKIGRGNCPHHRPRKRRNRACKECGYYTLEQAQNGGIVSGKVRRDRNTRRDRQIQGCKGDLPAPATAKKFGLSVRQIFRIWTRPRIPTPATAQQLAAWRRAQMETMTRTYTPVARNARMALVKLTCWRWHAQQQRDANPEPRFQKRFLSLIRKCSNEITRYGRAVRQMDGQAKWDAVLKDSRTLAAHHWEHGATWLRRSPNA